MIACIVNDCTRARVPDSPNGTRFALCDDHLCASLLDAFGESVPASWHGRARARSLPTAVTGGLPLRLAAEPARPGQPPRASVSPAQRSAAGTLTG